MRMSMKPPRAVLFSLIALSLAPHARAQLAVNPLAPPTTLPSRMALKRYAINDNQMFKTSVFTGIMPADWQVKGGIIWKMNLSNPDLLRIHWGDAQDISAFDIYPYLTFVWSAQGPALAGQTYMGSIVEAPPSDQFDAIAKVIIPLFRPELANAQVIDQKKLPDVAKAEYNKLIQTFSPQLFAIAVWAGTETFEYQLQNQTVQEVVSVTLDESLNRRFGTRSWSIPSANSNRAPKGAFDQLTLPRSIIFSSLQANPQWNQAVANYLKNRQQQVAVGQQNQFNAIENRINNQTSANAEEQQGFNQHMADLDRQSDAEADVQRQVSPWKTDDGSTYKLPTQYGYAWSGADGRIIMNNDPQYNPNSDLNLTPTQWTAMQQAGN
jgi:hypothetical protein